MLSRILHLYTMIDGRNNAERYVKILEDYLLQVKANMKAARVSNPVFMQEAGWEVADYPACSPDPIEHVFHYFKILHEKLPNLASFSGRPPAIKKRIAEYLEEA